MRIPTMVLASLLLAAAPALAAEGAKQNVSRQDESFAKEAMAGSAMELQMSQMAAGRAQSNAVRSFAQRMITEHSSASQKLTDAAGKAGIQASSELPKDQREHIEKLSKLQGAEFDRAYMAAMVDDHKKTVRNFERQAQEGSNPDLQTFAQQSVPTLKEHLQMAQDTEAAVKSGQTARQPE